MIKKPVTSFSKTRAKGARSNTTPISKKDQIQQLHQGIWCYIFEFIGLNGDLFKVRLVSKLFKRHVHRTMEMLIKREKSTTDSIDDRRTSLMKSLSPQLRDSVNQTLELREECANRLDQILKSKQIPTLPCLRNPYPSIMDGLRACLYIFIDPSLANEISGKDWNSLLLLLKTNKFTPMIKNCDPMKLSDYQISQFDLIQEMYNGLLQGNVDASFYVAGWVLDYATRCVNLKKLVNNLDLDAKDCLEMLANIEKRKSYIEKLEKIRGGFK